jgi:hypothetical protein
MQKVEERRMLNRMIYGAAESGRKNSNEAGSAKFSLGASGAIEWFIEFLI